MKTYINKKINIPKYIVLFTFVMGIIYPTLLQADRLNEQQVRSAVTTWVRYVTADAQPDAQIEYMQPYIVDGETLAYIAHLAGGGFCLCGCDDWVLPVYLYSPQGQYNPNISAYKYFMDEIVGRTILLSDSSMVSTLMQLGNSPDLAERPIYWQELIAGRVYQMTSTYQADYGISTLIRLNMVTQWNQNGPYNILCPLGDSFCTLCPSGGTPISRTWVGCVATAGAQVMKYWTWPFNGAQNNDYDWDGDDSCQDDTHHGIGATNLSAHITDTFDWANMANAYEWDDLVDFRFEDEYGNPVTQTQINAVAELSYETAVALEMDFGVCGSGIPTSELENVLEDYFYFDDDASYTDMDAGTVIKEIQFGRPVVMRGNSSSGGAHAFIIYGFNVGVFPIQYLMNIGHGAGTHNVWHTKGSVKWYIDQAIVYGMAPDYMVRFVGPGGFPFFDGSPANAYPNFVTALDDEDLPNGAVIVFKADTEQNFETYPKLINKPLTLRGHNVTIR